MDNSSRPNVQLYEAFEDIRKHRRESQRKRVARTVLGSSVIRVFAKGTKPGLFDTLHSLPVDDLPKMGSEGFEEWYEDQLEVVAQEIRRLNSRNRRLLPGLKWGHASKVLCLYLVGLVEQNRYFPASECKRIAFWLYVPIDSIAIDRLRGLGVDLTFRKIREIDTPEKFYGVQDLLGSAAKKARVPRIWFDDNWATRD